MTGSPETGEAKRPWDLPFLPPRLLFGFSVALILLLIVGALTAGARETQLATAAQMLDTLERTEETELLLSLMKDAESGQLGHLVTGDARYLERYEAAKRELPAHLESLRKVYAPLPDQTRRLRAVEQQLSDLMAFHAHTQALQAGGKHDEAVAGIKEGRGKAMMDRVRASVQELVQAEQAALRKDKEERSDAVTGSALITFGGLAVLLTLVLISAYITSGDYRRGQTEQWIRAGQASVALALQGDQRLETLGENVLSRMVQLVDAQVGAAFVAEGPDRFRRVAAHALPSNQGGAPVEVSAGEGLLGQAAKTRKAMTVTHLPAGYLPITSSVGQTASQHVLIAPAIDEGRVVGLVELGFLREPGPAELELLTRVTESMGVAIRSSRDRSRLEEMLEETQRQAEELQTQQEELRVSNEELQEQGRALRESQARLETQHEELEETNSQLEAQLRLLERQKEELSQAQSTLAQKASELALANQYKNDFLANMSHELRTPLNSSLILAKLLADNPQGNLTDEQVKFAQTIRSAGKDLLTLINDILDLAKIESGKVEVSIDTVVVPALFEELERSFGALAKERGLSLSFKLHEGAPASLDTDPQRLGQVLKNLISNAIKFTERGEVAVALRPQPAGKVAFDVRDTGIGVAAHQQELIFEAFRQADSGVHRKFGGTGLGLSISRELAHLLGGELTVKSTPNEGSTFTLTVPRKLESAVPRTVQPDLPTPARMELPAAPMPRRERAAAGLSLASLDRTAQEPATVAGDNERLILIIEDDLRFAEILQRTAKERGFTTAVATTADEGIQLARRLLPSAVLLDMNLPDHTGLSVLDQLKRRAATRHIPVHVLSVEDYSQEALQMGAVGYAMKPVAQEQLREAFQKLEARLAQTLRRVLIVEDNDTQRDSVRRLLQSEGVEVIGVGSASEALVKLGQETFDCVVMDLGLQDASGFELLETMAQQEKYAFPPVIVYTGRSLSLEEEQRLRKFSKSIIIKGAHSPERLLDEVTLFLHQVEARLPADRQRMLAQARHREALFEGRRILVVEDDVRNIFALSSMLEPKGAKVEVARNGREALEKLLQSEASAANTVDLVLMDIMMPEMDGITAMKEIRKKPEMRKLPIIALTAKAMRDDQETCLAAGANDYIAKPLDVEKLLSLVRVWMPK